MTQTNQSPLPVSASLRPGKRSDSASTTKAGEQAQHTPGPWKVDGDGVSDGLGQTITNYVEQDSDARLIAAAPDLLAACKSARSAITFGGKIDWNAISGELFAAIAKAEGRAQ